ncbi:MAK10-like protein, partial [Tanacetum coccineum]
MGDKNPIRTLGDYSRPSHEGYRNTIELPEGNNVVPLRSDTIRLVQNGCSFHGLRSEDPNQHLKDFLKLVDSLDLDGSISTCIMENFYLKHGLVSRTYSKKSLIMASIVGSKSKFSMIMSPFISSAKLTALLAENYAIRTPTNLGKLLRTSPFTTMKGGPSPQPQALNTTFEARVRDYMAAHTERMGRFKNAILKQREEINGRMTEMFGLLKELTPSKTPEKVLVREEAKFPVAKKVNSISLANEGDERSNEKMETPENTEKSTKTGTETPLKGAKTKDEAENKTETKPIKTPNEVEEVPGSQPIAYYLKHKINEKLNKGLVDNNRFNNSLSGIQVGKKKKKAYKVLPRGPVYKVILEKMIAKKEDIGGNFEIPCSIRGLKHVSALVDQGFDVNVMPYSTYIRLTDERLTETDIRLSLASHSYIYPLGIAEDVLIEVAEHVYPTNFIIVDIKENEKRPFILGMPFLTTAKASIKFDTGTITLRSRK